VTGPEGEQRFRGQQPPRRRFGLFSPSWFSANYADLRTEVVRWIDQPHAAVVDRLLPDVMWVSPLTSLLRPGWAPPGWSPLMAVEFLRSRPFARAVCHAWAREREWLRIGGVVAGSLMRSHHLPTEVVGEQQAGIPGTSAAMQRAAKRTIAETDDEDEQPSGVLAALPEPALTRAPEDIGAVVGALIHLHMLKVLEYDARISIGLGAR